MILFQSVDVREWECTRISKVAASVVLALIYIVASGCSAPPPAPATTSPATSPLSATSKSYSTSFSLTENPISENANWVGGQTAGGNLWGDLQTNGQSAFCVSEHT